MVKNISQKCAKCGQTNHTTQNHWPAGKCPQKGKGQKSQKASGSSGKKQRGKERKGTKCQHIKYCGHWRIANNYFVQYRELGQIHKAEIANRKYLKIEGYGTIIGHSKMLNSNKSLQIHNVLYVPEVNKWLFSLIATTLWSE